MARPAPLIDLTDEQRTLLEGISRSRETAHSLVRRARIVLRAAIEESLSDRPRSGNPGDSTAEQICRIIALACETPPDPLTHWTRDDPVRETIARGIASTISASTIGRF
ncbi:MULTISPECIES: helix-turn-helix domain-containing protein [unclassified Thiocapsa]|uniref:helix-turn-helix domain-containing protein n=1 Tax=unclassified Thiocapsa TaxID=2641286 RepID=UPI0035B37F32